MEQNAFDPKAHWETIYTKKGPQDVSWFQAMPKVSLDLFAEYRVPQNARIIDVGGGDSLLVDHLLDNGFRNVTVLDISGAALGKAKERLGERAGLVQWIESNATSFDAPAPFDVWHDRAVFHFLTSEADVDRYIDRLVKLLKPGGLLILATFSENGPEKCSGIPVHRYSEAEMVARLQKVCDRIKCFTVDHVTPFDTVQNFLFCAFRKAAF
ncbi:MAG: class I SAM-dependent methyltransferase [Flavobacteriales bacterium]|jgi:2-polyprenyl-3-methyl-5-hydroxy-6-metoxy-1,4-benzoquinol methylase|nr:class I SAM-dependent methyltransferase [Flavobacteriales bacterium]